MRRLQENPKIAGYVAADIVRRALPLVHVIVAPWQSASPRSTLAAAAPLPRAADDRAWRPADDDDRSRPGAIWVAQLPSGWTILTASTPHTRVQSSADFRDLGSADTAVASRRRFGLAASSWSTRYVIPHRPRSTGRVLGGSTSGPSQQAGILATPNAVWVAVRLPERSSGSTRDEPRSLRASTCGGKPDAGGRSSPDALWVAECSLARSRASNPRRIGWCAGCRWGPIPTTCGRCGGLVWTPNLHGPALAAVDPGSNSCHPAIASASGSKGLACGR